MKGRPLLAALALAVLATPARAQTANDAFAERVRAATERYQDHARAVADGYRLIGRDFPGMGEHWLHIGRLLDGVYDPDRPEFLNYLTVAAGRRLLGVAYALPLLEGETPPDAPAGMDAWHSHSATLDEETLAPQHRQHDGGHHGAGGGPRLVMFHAWAWLPNPEGFFAADNWAIPYLRLGLEPRTQPPVEAGKALALLVGADDYLTEAVATAGRLSDARTRRVRTTIAQARARVAALRKSSRRDSVDDREAEALAVIWRTLWPTIAHDLGDAAWARVEPLSIR